MRKNLRCIICVGIPASGKSTWSKEFLRKNPDFVRINRDDFRFMLRDQDMTEPKIEGMITELSYHAIDLALSYKCNLLVDNTNLKAKYITELINYVQHRADVEFMPFDISLEKALERDAARQKKVGEVVIKRMYEDYKILMDSFPLQNQSKRPFVYKEPIKFPDLPHAVIFDLDGTLAHANGKRGYFDWSKTDVDDLDQTVYRTYIRHMKAGDKMIIVTGRSEEARKPTEEWLEFYGLKYEQLLMRKADDFRKDSVVKKQIYETMIKPYYNVEVIYDDRNSVVDMWRSLGLKVFQVEKGFI